MDNDKTDKIASAQDSALNSFIKVTPEQALAAADVADQQRKAGDGGVLTGVPMAHKDIFCTQGITTTCASKILEGFVPPFDGTVVEKLKQSGLVMVGKTNLDEFAMGTELCQEHTH